MSAFPLDEALYREIHSLGDSHPVAILVAQMLSAIGGGWALVLLVPLVFGAARGHWAHTEGVPKTLVEALRPLLLAVTVTAVLVYLLKLGAGRVRPCYALSGIHAFCTPPTDPSFPSGHAAGSMATATVFVRRHRPLWPLLGVAVAVAWSRVLLGVHYPSDVAAGALLGATVGILATFRGNRQL